MRNEIQVMAGLACCVVRLLEETGTEHMMCVYMGGRVSVALWRTTIAVYIEPTGTVVIELGETVERVRVRLEPGQSTVIAIPRKWKHVDYVPGERP